MQQREKNNKGFNILELLVVLAIVGVISAVAYPNFSSWNKEREVRQSVARISTLIKNILIQTERGTFAYVQVLFDNSDSSNLVVTSKGMTMQSLATKINDGDDVAKLVATCLLGCVRLEKGGEGAAAKAARLKEAAP